MAHEKSIRKTQTAAEYRYPSVHHRSATYPIRRLVIWLQGKRRIFMIAFIFALVWITLVILAETVRYVDTAQGVRLGTIAAESQDDHVGDGPQLRLYAHDEPVALVHEAVLDYMSGEVSVPAVLRTYGRQGLRTDKGGSVTLPYTAAYLPGHVTVKNATYYVSETQDFANASVYLLSGYGANALTLPMLKANTVYYYKVQVTLSNGQLLQEESCFLTARQPRFLQVSGAINVRDIGGWCSAPDGRTVRQGLLYRGSELDGSSRAGYAVDGDGIADMVRLMNIKTQLDLRAEGSYVKGMDVLGKQVSHLCESGPAYDEIFTEKGRAALCRIFSVLADDASYPVYIHDDTGCDSTGTVVALLEASLGVPREDILKEYCLTQFACLDIRQQEFHSVLDQLQNSGEGDLQAGAIQFLLSCGITPEQLQCIEDILLTEDVVYWQ